MALKVLSVVGARPNFMKMSAICDAIKSFNQQDTAQELIDNVLVHTGQRYDSNMSDSFFNDLELPKPDLFLEVGSGSHSAHTAKIMERFEAVLLDQKPQVVLVVGDVNSTMGCALVTKKTWCKARESKGSFIPVLAHVEAGLRSFDRTMPEEINRMVTDCLSDCLFTTEESANRNLVCEGIPEQKIYFVGNVMIDTLLRHRGKAKESTILSDLQLVEANEIRPFAILTLHRPSNVDDKATFSRLLEAFLEVSKRMPVIFPAHPRTVKRIQEADLGDCFVDHFMDGPEPWDSRVRIRLVPPLGYLDFLRLMSAAKVVLTDSGGIQEESAILRVPCITLRENTERPVTIKNGSNVLVGSDPALICKEFRKILQCPDVSWPFPKYWDGDAAKRVVQILYGKYCPQPHPGFRQVEAGINVHQPGLL